MDIKPTEITLKLSYDELYDLAFHIKYSLRQSIISHWNTLQQNQDGEGLFNERNANDLRMMKEMFEVCGHSSSNENTINEFKKLFAEKREERKNVK